MSGICSSLTFDLSLSFLYSVKVLRCRFWSLDLIRFISIPVDVPHVRRVIFNTWFSSIRDNCSSQFAFWWPFYIQLNPYGYISYPTYFRKSSNSSEELHWQGKPVYCTNGLVSNLLQYSTYALIFIIFSCVIFAVFLCDVTARTQKVKKLL